jgi:hypothetical protein
MMLVLLPFCLTRGVAMTAPTREKFPPFEMTEEEAAATVGRFVMSPTAEPDPAGSGSGGREQAAPQGTVYVRAETFNEEDHEPPEEAEEEAEEEEAEEEKESTEEEALEEFTVSELKEELDSLGVEYPPHARKAELIELVQKAEKES